jgi:adenine-specific DNA-methyltransferase
VPNTLWMASEVGDTERSKKQVMEIFSERDSIGLHAPKPPELVQRIIKIASSVDSTILDSFAGSGTTAHAVLAQNAKDGGNRRFILVECESYADTLTAERVRRVVGGYAFQGTQREELHREKLTFTRLKKADELLRHVDSIENLEGARFDRIRKEVKDGELIVTGEKAIEERVAGLGGGFTYCTLGEPLELESLLSGRHLPSFEALGGYLFHTATGRPLEASGIDAARFYLGASAAHHVWLIYRPDLDFLRSRDAALSLEFAQRIAAQADLRHLVFAAARYVPNRLLQPLGVEFAPLPYALYRIEKD